MNTELETAPYRIRKIMSVMAITLVPQKSSKVRINSTPNSPSSTQRNENYSNMYPVHLKGIFVMFSCLTKPRKSFVIQAKRVILAGNKNNTSTMKKLANN